MMSRVMAMNRACPIVAIKIGGIMIVNTLRMSALNAVSSILLIVYCIIGTGVCSKIKTYLNVSREHITVHGSSK